MIGNDILTMDDFEFHGKTVLLRVDLNSPIDAKTQRIVDDSRIREHAKTVTELSEKGAKVAVLAHQGDPLFLDQFVPLEQHAQILSSLIGKEVKYVDDTFGPAAREAIRKLENGQVLMLENTRYFSEDTRLFEDAIKLSPQEQSRTMLVRKLYPLADVFVNDAFAAAHKSQPSLVGFTEVLPSIAGRVLESEVRALGKIRDHPRRPCVFCLGGRKISDKYEMMEPVLKNSVADCILTSGVIGLLMLKASGRDLGSPTESLISNMGYGKYVQVSARLLDTYGKDKMFFPSDLAVESGARRREVDSSSLPVEDPVKDIGSKTVEKYSAVIKQAATVFFSGPAGVIESEQFSFGTRRILEAITESRAFSVVGGGHSIAALRKYNLLDRVSYVSTGGGALVRFLSGEELPVIAALKKATHSMRSVSGV
jgi:phosphoglycerate kinase